MRKVIGRHLDRTRLKTPAKRLVAVAALLGLIACQPTSPTTLLSTDVSSATNVTYDFSADFTGASTTVQCIEILFSAKAYGQGGLPAGMNLTGASVVASGATDAYNWSGWSTSGNNGTGTVRITTSGTPTNNTGRVHIAVAGITNPSRGGTYWASAKFIGDQACGGANKTNEIVNAYFAIDGVGPGVGSTNAAIQIEPMLSFSTYNSFFGCNGQSNSVSASSNAVNLGSITPTSQKSGSQVLNVATNAPNGFAVYVRELSPIGLAPVSGTHAAPGNFPAIGTEAFGYTVNDSSLSGGTPDRFTTGGPKWAALANTSQEVLSASSSTVGCIGYRAGAAAASLPGVYTGSIGYIAAGNF